MLSPVGKDQIQQHSKWESADELFRRVPIVCRAGDYIFLVLGCSPLGSFRWSLGLCYGPYVHSSGWDLNLFLGLFYIR